MDKKAVKAVRAILRAMGRDVKRVRRALDVLRALDGFGGGANGNGEVEEAASAEMASAIQSLKGAVKNAEKLVDGIVTHAPTQEVDR